jgi:hypothetical protein
MVLPGVYIDVRPEGLIIPARVGVGNVGVVGTASRGTLKGAVRLGTYADARQAFGDYDQWVDGTKNELTLVRALELVFAGGATTVLAVRVVEVSGGQPTAVAASASLRSASGECVILRANTPGTWGDDLRVNVQQPADQPPFVEDEAHDGAATITLNSTPVLKDARNRIRHVVTATGFTRSLELIYDDSPNAPVPGQAKIDRASGTMTFGTTPDTADKIRVSYAVASGSGVKVTVRLIRGQEVAAQETYTVVNGNDLVRDVSNTLAPSGLVTATPGAHSTEPPAKSPTPDTYLPFSGGKNGEAAADADYQAGLDRLLQEDAHIILAAGRDVGFGPRLDAHCQNASTDVVQRDRIAVVGAGPGDAGRLPAVVGHNLASDRIVFAAPGIKATDAAAPGQPLVNLPGSYTAAVVAGLLAFHPPHVSLTNKTVPVPGLTVNWTRPQLTQALQSRVLVLEERQGIRIVRGITTSTNTAWTQITTRRIVDYAKYGVRSAALPYIGLLNNTRVRAALRATVNSFLAGMVDDEMLVSYELDVTATRQDEINGIAKVTMVLRPVFSIDFIKVTMFLQ